MEAHLLECADCRLEYQRLRPAPEPDPAMLTGLMTNIQRWEAAAGQPERSNQAVKRRVTSDIEPYLGSAAAGQVLGPATGENLLSPVESALAVFLGRSAAASLVNNVVDHAILLRGDSRTPGRRRSRWPLGETLRRLTAVQVGLIVLAIAGSAGLGWIAFHSGGSPSGNSSRFPATLTVLGLAALELWFSARVARHFSPGEPLRPAWILITASAVCNLAGAIFPEFLRARTPLMLAAEQFSGLAQAVTNWQQLTLALGGTCRFALLGAGLLLALRACWRLGFLKPLHFLDWLWLMIPAAYIVYNAIDLTTFGPPGGRVDLWVVLPWLVDPLLCVLFGVALVLFRSAQGMGRGWISLCWAWYTIGVFLTSLGDIGLWVARHGWLPRYLVTLTWYAWLPAAAALALAPAFQLQAIRRAMAVKSQAYVNAAGALRAPGRPGGLPH